MALPATLLGDHICLQAETFTGNLTNVYTPSSGKKIIISGWDLTVTGNTGIVTCSIVLGSTVHDSTLIPIAPTAANGSFNPWRILGIRISGAVDEVLKINGGGTSAAISGTIFLTEV